MLTLGKNSKKGFALWLALSIFVVLTMLAVALLARSRTNSLATRNYLTTIEEEMFFDSSMAWIEGSLLRDLSLGTKQNVTLKYESVDGDSLATFNFVSPSQEPTAPVEITRNDSFNNLRGRSWVTLDIEGDSQLRLPPGTVLVTFVSDFGKDWQVKSRRSSILKIQDPGELFPGTIGLFSKRTTAFYGKISMTRNSSSLDVNNKTAWVMASETNCLMNYVPIHAGCESPDLVGELFFHPDNGSLGSLVDYLPTKAKQVIQDRERFKAYENNLYGDIDVAAEVKKAKLLKEKGVIDSSNYDGTSLTLDPSSGARISYSNSGLTVKGDLKLKEGVALYVDGDLEVLGSITGKGSVYVNGDIKFEGSAEIGDRDKNISLMSAKDITLKGLDLMDFFGNETEAYKELISLQENKNEKVLGYLKQIKADIQEASFSNESNLKFTLKPTGVNPAKKASELIAGMTLYNSGAGYKKDLGGLFDAVAKDSKTSLEPKYHEAIAAQMEKSTHFYSAGSLWGIDGNIKSFDKGKFLNGDKDSLSSIWDEAKAKSEMKKFFRTTYPNYTDEKLEDLVDSYFKIGHEGNRGRSKDFLKKVMHDSVKAEDFAGKLDGAKGKDAKYSVGRSYDLACLVSFFENPSLSAPFLLDALSDEFDYAYGDGNEELMALYKYYGHERFLTLLDTAIAQVESIDFRYPGRTSFQGMLYAKGKVISKEPFQINGTVVLLSDEEGSDFGDGTHISLTPHTATLSENYYLMRLDVQVYLGDGL